MILSHNHSLELKLHSETDDLQHIKEAPPYLSMPEQTYLGMLLSIKALSGAAHRILPDQRGLFLRDLSRTQYAVLDELGDLLGITATRREYLKDYAIECETRL